MALWGNKHANAYFEARVPPHMKKPTQHSSVSEVTRWIRRQAASSSSAGVKGRLLSAGSGDEDENGPQRLLIHRHNHSTPNTQHKKLQAPSTRT